MNTPGNLEIWHVAIPVSDLERSVKFYCGVLDMRMVGRDQYSDKKQAFVVTRPGGFGIELFQPIGKAAESPPRRPDHLAFESSDLPAFRARLAAANIAGLPEIDTFDNGVKYLPLRDPDGIMIEVFQGRKLYEDSIKP